MSAASVKGSSSKSLNKPRRRISRGDEITPQQEKLDTFTFQCYFDNIWKSLPDEKRNSFAYLDCLWFNLYSKSYWQAKVLKWIKKKEIFSKKYVIVPIVRWDHWSLLIFCHMGESLQSKISTPCLLLLDSLRKTNPKRLEPEIRKHDTSMLREEFHDVILTVSCLCWTCTKQKRGLRTKSRFIEFHSRSPRYPSRRMIKIVAILCFITSNYSSRMLLKNLASPKATHTLRLGEEENAMAFLKFQENIFDENLERKEIKQNQVHFADHYPSKNLERQRSKRNQVHIANHYTQSEISSENLEYHHEKRVKENKSGSSKKEKKSSENLNLQISTKYDSQDIDLINFDDDDVIASLQFQEKNFNENLERRKITQNQVHFADHYPASENLERRRSKRNQVHVADHYPSSKNEKKLSENLNINFSTKYDSYDTDLINFDEDDVPPPVCSCTGFSRQCYKSGNGGWQSTCCTLSLSVYPLPRLQNKRHSRIVGRKMNGNVFKTLLTRLTEQGHDLSVPLDLKNYWAKHGSNRRITFK